MRLQIFKHKHFVLIKKNFYKNRTSNIFSSTKKDLNFSAKEKTEKTESNNIYTNENTKENTMPNKTISFKKRILSSSTRNKRNNFFSAKDSKFPNKSNFSINSPKIPVLFEDKGEEKFRNLINIDINKLYSTNKKNI